MYGQDFVAPVRCDSLLLLFETPKAFMLQPSVACGDARFSFFVFSVTFFCISSYGTNLTRNTTSVYYHSHQSTNAAYIPGRARQSGNNSKKREPLFIFIFRSNSNLSNMFYPRSPINIPPALSALQGEWLAFSSKAEEAGFWDVGASVAVGVNGSSISYRVLVNATNCSSAETDGYDGLGSVGVDLLNGPVYYEYTGSWEAFEMAMREDVWVPQGEHRILFCADSGLFNLNYLRFWTPTPTPAPTPVPSPAPTAAPQVPSEEGDDTKWIYISVSQSVWFVPGTY